MAFDPAQLADIKAALKVSDVVGARYPLQRRGTEYVVKDNPSFTVNDAKGFWCEFGAGPGGDAKPHDIFDFLQIHEGYTLVGAIEELAKRSGIILKQRPGASPHGAGRRRTSAQASVGDPRDAIREAGDGDTGRDEGGPPPHDAWPEGAVRGTSSAPAARGNSREIVATWDIKDPENTLLYQVVRQQLKDPATGEWALNREGKIDKRILQRRPSPDGDGSWLWGLDVIDRKSGKPLQFCRYRTGDDWIRYKDTYRGNPEIREFPDARNVDHWLYNANAVIDELREPPDDQRDIFLPEGEKKVDALKEWGLLAVTNTGGAKHFTAECAEFFRNARHVILLEDNDRASKERSQKVGAMLKAVGVQRVSTLNFRDHWRECPHKGDVVDWRDHGAGTGEKLLELVDKASEWVPAPFESKYGTKTATDLMAPTRAYPWRVKGIAPLNDNMLIMGPSGSGKTFEVLDMLMSVHFGEPFAGRKVVPGGFVYLGYEGTSGFENRVRAYMLAHNLKAEDLHSFAWLTRPPQLFMEEDDVAKLGEFIAALAGRFRLPLAAVIVDTNNAATRGSSEIKSEDIGVIMHRYSMISEAAKAPLWIVGHTNAEGEHRGNKQVGNTIETQVRIERTYVDAKRTILRRDDEGRIIRRATIAKQRDGDDHIHWDFVLKLVEIGKDEDGEPITSMVSAEPAQKVPQSAADEATRGPRPEGYFLSDALVGQFQALLKALEDHGVPPPPELQLPKSITKVVESPLIGSTWRNSNPPKEGEDYQAYRKNLNTEMNRFRKRLKNVGVIGVGRIAGENETLGTYYVWPTGKPVWGRGLKWPRESRRAKATQPEPMPIDQATGKEMEAPDAPSSPPKTVF